MTLTLEEARSAFLSHDELWTLTGYKYPAYQVRWLVKRGIPHWVNKSGQPVVRRDFGTQQRKELGAVR